MRTRLGPAGLTAAAVLVIVVLVSVCAPLLAPYDPDRPDLYTALTGSTGSHLLGGDALGRDILSRLMFGARTTLVGPLVIIALSTVVGTVLAITPPGAEGGSTPCCPGCSTCCSRCPASCSPW